MHGKKCSHNADCSSAAGSKNWKMRWMLPHETAKCNKDFDLTNHNDTVEPSFSRAKLAKQTNLVDTKGGCEQKDEWEPNPRRW